MGFMYQNREHGFSLDNAIAYAPTLGAAEPHGSRSERYGMVSTRSILEGMFEHGFQLHGISTANVRDKSKVGFEKHMLRFRKPDSHRTGGTINEVIAINSHDGSTCFQMFAGMFRFVCSNGLIVGDRFDEVKVKHSRNAVQDVIEGATRVVQSFDMVTESRERMRGITLKQDEKDVLAEAILPVRFNVETYQEAPISPRQLLTPRRYEDRADDLWTTFNVIQENVIQGGLRGKTIGSNGRRRNMQMKSIGGIDQNVRVNRALHMMAERMAELKEAA